MCYENIECFLIRPAAFTCCAVLILPALPIHPEVGGQADVGGGVQWEDSLCLPDISDGVFIFTGLLRNLIGLFFMGSTFLALFQSTHSSFPFIFLLFIKFCLTTGRSDKIVYEELVALVFSIFMVTMIVLICLRKDNLVIS